MKRGAVSRNAEQTRERILDAAERLFARQGFAGASLRSIIQEAGVNVAAVHYHYGSKEALLAAVLHRVVDPVNEERLCLLAEIERETGEETPAVEAILTAFLTPGFRFIRDHGEQGLLVTRFLGRTATEPASLVRNLTRDQFAEVGGRYGDALARAIPGIPRAELAWRFELAVAVLTSFLADAGRGALFPNEDLADIDATVQRLVAFLTPGLRAPPMTLERDEEPR